MSAPLWYGAFDVRKVRRCPASPWEGVKAHSEPCVDGQTHRWGIVVDVDGVGCADCGVMYLGGPTVEVKS